MDYVQKLKERCLNNKYSTWYFKIISNSLTRCPQEYTKYQKKSQGLKSFKYIELHHIMPRCMCDYEQDKDTFNLVCLTAKEHFLCHHLLTKMFENEIKFKMLYAFSMMQQLSYFNESRKEINARFYEDCKMAHQQAAKHFLYERQKTQGLTKNKTKFVNKITKEIKIFDLNFKDANWETFNSNKIVAINIQTQEKCLISKDEFKNNPIYVGHSKGMVSVINKETNQKEYIKTSDVNPLKHIYHNKGRKWNHSIETLQDMIGMTTAKTLDNKFIRVHKDDDRFKLGQLGGSRSKCFDINGIKTINYRMSHKNLFRDKFQRAINKLKINETMFFTDKLEYTVTRIF